MERMNTDINSVNHGNMDQKAKEMRQKALEMNTNLAKAYEIMQKLHADNKWKGNRYNIVSAAFNKQVDCLNSILTSTVTDIPFAIEVAANNYSSADGTGRPHDEIKKPINSIQKLSETNKADVMTYIPDAVHQAQATINDYINQAKRDLEEIIRLYGEVNWKTEGASIAFKNSLNDSKEKIDAALKEVTAIINEQIDESDKAMKESEDSSTVNGSKA